MPRVRPHFCKICGGHDSQVGRVSMRGKCRYCGDERVVENHEQLRAHDGPWFEHWRRRTMAAFGIVLLDETDESR